MQTMGSFRLHVGMCYQISLLHKHHHVLCRVRPSELLGVGLYCPAAFDCLQRALSHTAGCRLFDVFFRKLEGMCCELQRVYGDLVCLASVLVAS